MRHASGRSAGFGEINMRYDMRYLLLFVSSLFAGCSGGHPEYFVKSLSNKYYGIPFDKDRVTELRISYWVKVREEGIYDGVFDTGIRRRILSITDKDTINHLLSYLEVVDRGWYTVGIRDDIEFVISPEETWCAHFISARTLATSPERSLRLKSPRFFHACRALCFRQERDIRNLPANAFEWISLSYADAHKLPSIGYDVRFDGISHEVMYIPKIVDVVEEKRRKDNDERFKHSKENSLYGNEFWE